MRKNLVLLFCSVLLAGLFSELVVRWLHLAPQLIPLEIDARKSGYVSSKNPVLGYELRPNLRDPEATLHFGSFPATNSHGQRDRERTWEKPQGTRRIILLGDSVVAGHGIWSLDDTISRQLERSLQAKGPIEVLNLGVGGYQTLAEAELLRTKGVRYAPDLVILLFDNSDFDPANYSIQWSHDPQIGSLLRFALKASHLFRLVAIRLDLSGLRFRTDLDYRVALHRSLLQDSVEEGLRRMQRLSREEHFEFFLVIWPRFGHTSGMIRTPEELYPSREEAEKSLRIQDLCRRNAIACYPLAPAFAEDWNRSLAVSGERATRTPDGTYTIGDTCHPKEEAARLAADAIEKILHERNFLP